MEQVVFGPRAGDNFRPFKLAEGFLQGLAEQTPNWGEVGYIVYKRTYARPLENGETEEWWQTVQRVVEGVFTVQKLHCRNMRIYWDNRKAQRSAQEMAQRMFEFKFLPPGRGLWGMGTPAMFRKGGALLNNCGFTTTKDINRNFTEPFTWLMDMLMLGVGVGFDTRGAGSCSIYTPTVEVEGHWEVGDSREEWVRIVESVLKAFSRPLNKLPGIIDFSAVRKKGEPLSSGGTASGPKPLVELIQNIVRLFTGTTVEYYEEASYLYLPQDLSGPDIQPMTQTLIVDVMNYIGKCVVSGGIRRSAEIALGHWEDATFVKLKDDTYALQDRRWASNNSVVVGAGESPDYNRLVPSIVNRGEPGVFWLDNARQFGRMRDKPDGKDYRVLGVNPCGEQSLEPWELCCLVETFPSLHDTAEDYMRTLKYAYLYAKTVTLIPTNSEKTNAVMLRNRRIGTSMTGIQEAIAKFGLREFRDTFCDWGYKTIKQWDSVYSEWFCIPQSIKVTSVKPSGTVSLLPGVTAGIHWAHSEYMIKTMRIADTSALVEPLKEAGYYWEEAVKEPNTLVFSFPIHKKNFTKGKDDVSLWEQFEMAALMQEYWADNQVSVTITFKPHEAKDIATCLEMYERRLKAVSLFPHVDDSGYVQPPLTKITAEEYANLTANLQVPNFTGNTHEAEEKFCDGEACTI